MGNPKAFLTIHRQEAGYRPVHERIDDFSEVEQTLNSSDRRTQASRCMDCGVPFCHWACPLGNKQPEWQDLLYKGRWREAFHVLEQTCDFPEFTGRICPALCEKSCVLKLSCDEPVTIRENEASIVEAAFREGYIQPVRPIRNGKRVAVIGSGPAGLTAANQLNRRGYEVTVFEKYELPGGLLRLRITNFKVGKNRLKGVEVAEVEWLPAKNGGRPEMWKTGRTEIIEADLVFLAMGFIHPEQEGLIKELSIAVDTRGNIAVDPGTNRIADTNIFASGDAVSGASLVVRAMASGRKAAAAIDKYLHPHKS